MNNFTQRRRDAEKRKVETACLAILCALPSLREMFCPFPSRRPLGRHKPRESPALLPAARVLEVNNFTPHYNIARGSTPL